MNNTLSKEKMQAISKLYTVSESFRKTVDTSIMVEANLASNMAKVLMAAVDIPGVVDPAPVKAPGKKRGPKPGSKRKPKVAVTNEKPGVPPKTLLSHKDAIKQVLKAAGNEGMTKKNIEEKFPSINGYKVPSSGTLLTTLHGMKEAGVISASGERPNLHYSLVK